MKKLLSRFVFFSGSIIIAFMLNGCTKKDTISTPGESETFATTIEKASSPAADPAIAYVNNNKLMVMNTDGSNKTVIASGTSIGAPSWSPDAHSIVFPGTVNAVNGLWVVDVAVVNGVPTGSNLHKITINLAGTPGSPSWSPLGDLIAFTNSTSPDYDRNIYTIAPTGGTPTIVYTSATELFPRQPDWSPDASKLVFSEATIAAPYQWNLLTYDLSNLQVTTVIPLTSSIAVKGSAWSRNGDRIAYSNGNSNPEAIYTVTPTSNATPIKVVDGAFPTWSPNDSKLAYNGSKPAGIYSYSFSSGTRQKLADGTWADWRRF